ncbi:MAG TPA: HPF/RaiA family ribosome-associated protein [Actinomycetota bacterium]
MDVVVKGRGIRLTEAMRHAVTTKLAKLERRPRPDVLRVEVEVLGEPNPRVGSRYRVQVAAVTARRTFRAEGGGPDVDSSLDQVVERIRRQIATYRGKKATRPPAKHGGLQSGAGSHGPAPE